MDSVSKTCSKLTVRHCQPVYTRQFLHRCQITCVKIFCYFITYIVYVIPVIMKNIWPVKTACCDIILYFIACQNVFYFVLPGVSERRIVV